MNLLRISAVVLLVAALASCGITRRDTNKWLDSRAGTSTIDMTGEWDSSESLSGSWGRGKFFQESNRFSGTLGRYYAEGTVNNDNIFMVLYSGDTVYYTAILKKSDNGGYMGKAVYVEIADSEDAKTAQSYLMSLKKVIRE